MYLLVGEFIMSETMIGGTIFCQKPMRKYCLPWHREPRLEDLRRVGDGRREELLEVLVLRQLVVSRLPPLMDGLQREYYYYKIIIMMHSRISFSSPLRGI